MLNINKFEDYSPLFCDLETIAVVGLSPKEERPSNMVARYLKSAGYKIYPVNPGHGSILGLQCYARLSEVPVPIDLVNIFRKSADVYPVVEEAIEMGAKGIWMQNGIINTKAADLAVQNGLAVVMDRCLKVEHQNLQFSSR